MSSRRILTVVGARPQFIKAAVLTRALAKRGLAEVMVHTGQHFDPGMSDIFFDELEIPAPAHHLGIHGGGHGEMTGRMLAAIEPVMITEKPDVVVVYGDTNSTVAGALAASKLRLPVAHVEAGLRSFDRRMPEEVNRVVADHLSDILLAPTKAGVANLADEGITRGVHHVGDVMYDATLQAQRRAESHSRILETLGLAPRTFAVATVHRSENTDVPEALARTMDWLGELAREQPVVLPLHPRTRQALERDGIGTGNIRIIEPLGYLDMTRLVGNAAAVYTDSGGLQKEAYFHRVPCVTLRSTTEWVETVAAGWNRLWDTPDYATPRRAIDDFGDGHAAEAIADILVTWR